MKKEIIITIAASILCFVIGLLVGRVNMLTGNSVASNGTVFDLETFEVRVNAGNVEYFNGVEWVVYGKVEDLLKADEMSVEELKEYYYPIIVKQLEDESKAAEEESIRESESASLAEQESIAVAESEAASKAAEQKAKNPAIANAPVYRPAAPAPVQEEENDDDDDDSSSGGGSPAPEPEPEPEPDPVEDNSGDGEDMEWSNDIL